MRIFDFLKRKNNCQDNISESEAEFEMHSAKPLFSYLSLKLENAVTYEDLFNLCFALFCTLDILPENLKTLKLSKEVLAMTFAKLARERKIINFNTNKSIELMFNDISDEKHWIEQIKVHMIANKWPNKESARILLERS
ncbi:hypothetical protein [Flavobacterium aquicola]|uniref:Uncharacterized protein n=1 Tax=Flavobacterium aquicola TaxID=1682742 RepID=A0A3E0ELF0_9FLAO|nr:hypothetical protein [Flavobacterium aquicola]REG99001.1 hypothetical protein C8P67_105166 [Flavobacterium aquicola]